MLKREKQHNKRRSKRRQTYERAVLYEVFEPVIYPVFFGKIGKHYPRKRTDGRQERPDVASDDDGVNGTKIFRAFKRGRDGRKQYAHRDIVYKVRRQKGRSAVKKDNVVFAEKPAYNLGNAPFVKAYHEHEHRDNEGHQLPREPQSR